MLNKLKIIIIQFKTHLNDLYINLQKNHFYIKMVSHEMFQLFNNYLLKGQYIKILNNFWNHFKYSFLLFLLSILSVYLISFYFLVVEATFLETSVYIEQHNLQTVNNATVTGLYRCEFLGNNNIYLVGIASPIFCYGENFIWDNFVSIFPEAYVPINTFAYSCYIINITIMEDKWLRTITWAMPASTPNFLLAK